MRSKIWSEFMNLTLNVINLFVSGHIKMKSKMFISGNIKIQIKLHAFWPIIFELLTFTGNQKIPKGLKRKQVYDWMSLTYLYQVWVNQNEIRRIHQQKYQYFANLRKLYHVWSPEVDHLSTKMSCKSGNTLKNRREAKYTDKLHSKQCDGLLDCSYWTDF